MLKMLALEINQTTYPIAAGFLGGGFLAVPEIDTYGCYVVINEIVAPTARPVNGRGPRLIRSSSPRRYREDRSITFENTWYEKETFEVEYSVGRPIVSYSPFLEVVRKSEEDIRKYYQEKGLGHGDHRTNCACEGQCEFCHDC